MAPTEAGNGEHRVHFVPGGSSSDKAKLTAGAHYVGVDAVSWFINKAGGFFSDRMASGTLEIKLAGGAESYQIALGTYALESGAKTAPVFGKSVLPDRNYRGGAIAFTASLSAIRKDSAIAGLLRSAAEASLGVAAGMVETAAIAGPAKLLGDAGSSIISGVRQLLSDTGQSKEQIFDFGGLEFSIRPEQVIGPECYVLLHRGASLDSSMLTVRREGAIELPHYGDAPLDDGAWLLLRVRRSDEYSGVREWFDSARMLRMRVDAIVDDVASGSITKADALQQFLASNTGGKTLYDEFVRLRSIIHADGVVSEREAAAYVSQLVARITSARAAISNDSKEQYAQNLRRFGDALANGAAPIAQLADVVLAEAAALQQSRSGTIARDTPVQRVVNFGPSAMFETLRHLRKLNAEYASSLMPLSKW
jgi:hypothetical protein